MATTTTMSSPAAKRARLTGPLIGTHNGHFHADEALAVYLLRLLPTYSASPLVRTRDPSVLETCHTVVDVGGVHDAAINRYDHHQREFSATFPDRPTKLSSAGLVYMHMGRQIIAQHTGLQEESAKVGLLWRKLYEDFVEAFDANDNGVSVYDVGKLQEAGVGKRFQDRGFSIASVVSRFNHDDNDAKEAQDPRGLQGAETSTKEDEQRAEDERFLKASAFTGSQFRAELADAWRSWLPAREVVEKCFAERIQYDAQGRIMVLPWRKEGLPWHDHLFNIEAQEGVAGSVLYGLFPENGEEGSRWRVRAVSKSQDGFELRKPLPEKWRGVRDEQLDEVTGIPGGGVRACFRVYWRQ